MAAVFRRSARRLVRESPATSRAPQGDDRGVRILAITRFQRCLDAPKLISLHGSPRIAGHPSIGHSRVVASVQVAGARRTGCHGHGHPIAPPEARIVDPWTSDLVARRDRGRPEARSSSAPTTPPGAKQKRLRNAIHRRCRVASGCRLLAGSRSLADFLMEIAGDSQQRHNHLGRKCGGRGRVAAPRPPSAAERHLHRCDARLVGAGPSGMTNAVRRPRAPPTAASRPCGHPDARRQDVSPAGVA